MKKLVYTRVRSGPTAPRYSGIPGDSIESKPMELSSGEPAYGGTANRRLSSIRLQYYSVVRPSNVMGQEAILTLRVQWSCLLTITGIYSKSHFLVVWGDGTAIRGFRFSSRDCAEGIILALLLRDKISPLLEHRQLGRGVSIRELVEGPCSNS